MNQMDLVHLMYRGLSERNESDLHDLERGWEPPRAEG